MEIQSHQLQCEVFEKVDLAIHHVMIGSAEHTRVNLAALMQLTFVILEEVLSDGFALFFGISGSRARDSSSTKA